MAVCAFVQCAPLDLSGCAQLAETCDPEVLRSLYNKADRLRLLLEAGEGERRDSPFMAAEKMDQTGTGLEATPEVGGLVDMYILFLFFVSAVIFFLWKWKLRK